MDELDKRIEEIFQMADTTDVVAVRVVYPDGGLKTYLTEGGKDEPKSIAVLNGDLEEKVFLLFRYPELKSKHVEPYVIEKIEKDKSFRDRYWRNIMLVRSELRKQFKDKLFEEAREILTPKDDESTPTVTEPPVQTTAEAKPIYKSRTIIGSTIAGAIVTLMHKFGVDMTVEEVTALFILLTWFFRAITNKPLR